MAPPSKKRKISTSAPAEIKFDFSAREEYLTGFHKRKQARIKHAQEQAARQEKEERLKLRKQLREKRKEDLEKHVNEVNSLLRKANDDLSEGGETTENVDDDEDEFKGFGESQPEDINREEEYIDEDKFTTVTIESVGISRDGFEHVGKDKEEDQDGDKENDVGTEAKEDGTSDRKKRVWTKEKPKTDRPKKKKKQKFRYESKAERKITRAKQSAKNRRQAEARKSK